MTKHEAHTVTEGRQPNHDGTFLADNLDELIESGKLKLSPRKIKSSFLSIIGGRTEE
jgi:hypothetical protein